MSIVSDAYEYDVFYSYAWATNPTGDPALCNWTRMVADTISRLVRVRFGSVMSSQIAGYVDASAINADSTSVTFMYTEGGPLVQGGLAPPLALCGDPMPTALRQDLWARPCRP